MISAPDGVDGLFNFFFNKSFILDGFKNFCIINSLFQLLSNNSNISKS